MARAKASIGTANYATAIATGHHKLTADEGPELGGKDAGPAPYDLLTSALAACTVITLRVCRAQAVAVTAVHADVHYVREGDKRTSTACSPSRARSMTSRRSAWPTSPSARHPHPEGGLEIKTTFG
jgi:organic hydroperoxide reductase OsmC/OhrA